MPSTAVKPVRLYCSLNVDRIVDACPRSNEDAHDERQQTPGLSLSVEGFSAICSSFFFFACPVRNKISFFVHQHLRWKNRESETPDVAVASRLL